MEKEFEFKTISLKADENGSVSAVIAQFGVIDHDGDIVETTAFKNGQEVAIAWSHDWSELVGKGMITVTATEAIFNGSFFMDTQAGVEAYKTVKAMGDLQEWSWGFHTVKSTWEQRDEQMIRHLVECEVYEVSPVLKGAGIGTRTLAIKGKTTLEEHINHVLESVDSLGERVRSVKGMRQEEGRKISQERRDEVQALAVKLHQAADQLTLSITDTPEVNPAENQKLFNQFQKINARLNGVGEGN